MALTPEDIQRLEKPLPLEDHEAREKGTSRDKTKKQYLIYINQEGVIPLLNSIDPDWTWDVLNVHFEPYYVSVTGRLTIKGVARDGVGGNSPNGKDAPVDEDTVKGAETDALKRAALRFGVGLYLRGAPTFWIDANLPSWEGAKQATTEFSNWYKREFAVQNGAKVSTPPQRPQNAPDRLAGAENAIVPNASPSSTPAGKPDGDDFAKQFPAASKWTAVELYSTMHDYFNSPQHFEHHMDKHAGEYTGLTLEEAQALVRELHWNYDTDTVKMLCAWADTNLGMSPANVVSALGVKKFRDWGGGGYSMALAKCEEWADEQAAKDLEREAKV